jgi:DNA processing protein
MVMMLDKGNLLDENIALVALLNSIDRKHESWPSIANAVERNGSAIKVFDHEMDPVRNHLFDDENPEDLENACPTLFDDGDIPPSDARKEQLADALRNAHEQVLSWKDRGLDFVSVLDERYPNRLRQVVDMPPFLFAEGTLIQDEMGVSVVGSRHATPESLAFARDTSSMLVHDRFAVIAGLAAGIDAAAHTQALAEHGRTVAFIGTGITRQYPRENQELQERIGMQGLVLSQFWPEQGPTKHTFPMRNASMSGYGVATVVVQANEYSGTRIQARQAQQHGRPVILRDCVARDTQWGRKLRNRPGVYIASTVDDVRAILNDILNMGKMLETTIDHLVEMEPIR